MTSEGWQSCRSLLERPYDSVMFAQRLGQGGIPRSALATILFAAPKFDRLTVRSMPVGVCPGFLAFY